MIQENNYLHSDLGISIKFPKRHCEGDTTDAIILVNRLLRCARNDEFSGSYKCPNHNNQSHQCSIFK